MKKEKSFSFIEFYEKFGIIFILVIEFIIFSLASANFLTIVVYRNCRGWNDYGIAHGGD